jgi:hypothetical protein
LAAASEPATPTPDTLTTEPRPPSKLVEELRRLTAGLPQSVAVGKDNDPLTTFACDPKAIDKDGFPSSELWERLLNDKMKAVFGWGTDTHPGSIIRRGELGMEGFVRFVEYFVVERGVEEPLFEGKLGLLMEEMQRM